MTKKVYKQELKSICVKLAKKQNYELKEAV